MPLVLKKDADTIVVTDADLVPEGAKDVTFTLRHITMEKNREVQRRHTTKVPNKRSHKLEEVVDWEGVGDDLLDYALADWSGVVYEDAVIPCTSENKALLDGVRRAAILERSGMNEVQSAPERRAESFRPPSAVR